MPSHLHISVTFLQPMCHARMGKEGAAPNEWPPSPLRLFQAMVAGAAARWVGDGDPKGSAALIAEAPISALKWLESLCAASPPTILAPYAVTGQAVPRYVPNNSADLVAAKWARGDALATFEDRTKKVFRPTHLLSGPPHTVHYLWPLTDEQRREANRHEPTIAAAARCIVALGWGIDAAIGDARLIDAEQTAALAEDEGERWEPGRVGTAGLRLPAPGTLDALSRRHAAFLDRLKDGVFHSVPPLRTFTTSSYRRATNLSPRPFAAFKLVRPDDTSERFATFPQYGAAHVAAMLRHATCEAAKRDLDPGAGREWGSRVVAGHGIADKRRSKDDDSPRLSYLPLPSFEMRDRDRSAVVGDIRRVVVAEFTGQDTADSIAWVRQRLNGELLIDERTGGAVAMLAPLSEDDYVLQHYTGGREGSRVWASVTPVILPGYDDGKPAKRERLLNACLKQAGLLAAVESIESRPPSWFPGVASNSQFNDLNIKGLFKRRPDHLRHLPAVHVRLRFREPIRGPLSLGAGRHCGLGILAAAMA